jgi:hypothetical protein
MAKCTAYIATTAAKLKQLESKAKAARGPARLTLAKQVSTTRTALAAARSALKRLVR